MTSRACAITVALLVLVACRPPGTTLDSGALGGQTPDDAGTLLDAGARVDGGEHSDGGDARFDAGAPDADAGLCPFDSPSRSLCGGGDCGTAIQPAACPGIHPVIGTACADEGIACQYCLGDIDQVRTVRCESSLWTCPTIGLCEGGWLFDAGIPDAGVDAGDDAGPRDAGFDAGDPYCHYDCFGDVMCVDGGVIRYFHAPIPCAEWQGDCPHEAIPCEQGCRDDFDTVDRWSLYFDPATACEENRPRRVGDACQGDLECANTPATENPDSSVTNTYLRCDVDAGLCVEDDPPVVPDWLALCSLSYTSIESDPEGLSYGYVDAPSCSGGVCLVSEYDTCIAQGCTIACELDRDCPQGSTCFEGVNWTPANDGGPSSSLRVCKPGWRNLIGLGLQCP